jgi:cobalt-zinc-cadmium efflux system outer membrane protein
MNLLLVAAFVAALTVWPRFGVAGENGLTLDQAMARARERAPAIVAARSAIDEARGRLIGASVLLRDNPEVEGGAGARLVERGELLEGNFGVRQVFELGGRRGARIASATAAVAHESATSADVTRRVLRDTAIVFWSAVHAAERQRLAEEAAGLGEETLHIAQRRYQAGDIGILDVNVARAALARARSGVQAQMAARDASLGALRLTMGMDADEPLAVRGDLRERPHYTLPALLAHTSERPDLQALAAGARQAEADMHLGRALQWPTVGVGASYERDDGNNVAMGNVTITLPVFERGQGLRAEAAARQRHAQLALEADRRSVSVEVQTTFTVYQRREDAVIELERNALPGLDDNEALARRSYAAGHLSLAELLLIRREILETKSEHLSRLLEAAVAGVELEASAGVLQ